MSLYEIPAVGPTSENPSAIDYYLTQMPTRQRAESLADYVPPIHFSTLGEADS